jgi:hypothetical protein
MKDASKEAGVSWGLSKISKTHPNTDTPRETRNTQRSSITYTYVQELLKNTLVMQGMEKCREGNGEEESTT